MLVGEAYGEQEERENRPFVGMSGKILDGMLEEVGIKREDCYVTNVMMQRPPSNDFGKFYADKARHKPTAELQEGIRRLHEEVKRIKPNVVVALGDEPMRALVSTHGISNWRGSVLTTADGFKVIPTFHPSAVGREWSFRPAAICDLRRVLENASFPEIRRTSRELVTARNFDLAIQLLEDIKRGAEYVAFDIETEADQITCIGFAPSHRPNWAVCIPFWFGASGSLWTEDQEYVLWSHIRDILQSERIKKVAHNGSYDIEVLDRTVGLNVRCYDLDTMLMFHTLYPELPQALAFVVSLYTDHPYYKYQRKTASMDEYFVYNATDACLTMEIALKLLEELRENNQESFYRELVHRLIDPLLTMQKKGVRFNAGLRTTVKHQVIKEIEVLQAKLDEEVGHALNVRSPLQMKNWLYKELGLKERTKKRKGTNEITIAADEETLEAIYQETKDERIKTILAIREKQKVLSTYLEVELDQDKRIRCSYLISGTETGRLSSRETLRGTGTNLQNIPSGVIRSLFIPDEGQVFINADLSQAEARVVAYISGDDRLIRVFNEGGDIHRRNAANIFACDISAVSDVQRQLAKRVVHASNYGMGPRTFSRTAGISEIESTRLLNQYFATYPGIKRWHLEIATKLKRSRILVTPLGRKRIFFNKWQEATVKEALAYVPQSTVADIVNKGLIRLHEDGSKRMDILLQVHDSVLVQTPKDMLEDSIRRIKEAFTVPVEINRRTLVIPVDFKVGNNWDKMEKWGG